MDTKKKLFCPSCGNGLTKIRAGRITVDACENGCGGLWFDPLELSKVNESNEPGGKALLNIKKNPNVSVDTTKKRLCPVCKVAFYTHAITYGAFFMMDECPECMGIWLDDGEFAKFRGDSDSASSNVFVSTEAKSLLNESKRPWLVKVYNFLTGEN